MPGGSVTVMLFDPTTSTPPTELDALRAGGRSVIEAWASLQGHGSCGAAYRAWRA
jgi:hypothetical protein